jgi:hypothetical protein
MNTPEPKASISTTFSVGGQDFDPDQFSAVARCQPTKIWRARGAVKNNPAFAQIVWSFKLIKRPHWSVDDAVREMLGRFDEHREQIVSFARQHKCSLGLRCRLHGDETVIIYEIERSTIEQLAAFRSSFSFSIGRRSEKS